MKTTTAILACAHESAHGIRTSEPNLRHAVAERVRSSTCLAAQLAGELSLTPEEAEDLLWDLAAVAAKHAVAALEYAAIDSCHRDRHGAHGYWQYGRLYRSREEAVAEGYDGRCCSCDSVRDPIAAAMAEGREPTADEVAERRSGELARAILTGMPLNDMRPAQPLLSTMQELSAPVRAMAHWGRSLVPHDIYIAQCEAMREINHDLAERLAQIVCRSLDDGETDAAARIRRRGRDGR